MRLNQTTELAGDVRQPDLQWIARRGANYAEGDGAVFPTIARDHPVPRALGTAIDAEDAHPGTARPA
jgi:hypothetical protein